MIATICKRFQRRTERRAARDRYFSLDEVTGSLLWDEDYNDKQRRISNLGLLAYTAGEMARECTVFDNNRTDSDGYTPAQWHEHEASLYLLVEAAEKNDYSAVGLDPTALSLWLDPRIDELLHQIAEATEMVAKGKLLLRLRDEVRFYIGRQASEALAALAHTYLISSGMTAREAHRLVWKVPAAEN